MPVGSEDDGGIHCCGPWFVWAKPLTRHVLQTEAEAEPNIRTDSEVGSEGSTLVRECCHRKVLSRIETVYKNGLHVVTVHLFAGESDPKVEVFFVYRSNADRLRASSLYVRYCVTSAASHLPASS